MRKPPAAGATDQGGSRQAERPRSQRSRGEQRQRARGTEATSLRQGRGRRGYWGRWGAGAALASVVPRPPGTVMPTAPVPGGPFPRMKSLRSWEGNGRFKQRSQFKVKGQTAGTVHIEKKGGPFWARAGGHRTGSRPPQTLCVWGWGDKTLGRWALKWEPECVSLPTSGPRSLPRPASRYAATKSSRDNGW